MKSAIVARQITTRYLQKDASHANVMKRVVSITHQFATLAMDNVDANRTSKDAIVIGSSLSLQIYHI